jgi:hypothetical protein
VQWSYRNLAVLSNLTLHSSFYLLEKEGIAPKNIVKLYYKLHMKVSDITGHHRLLPGCRKLETKLFCTTLLWMVRVIN